MTPQEFTERFSVLYNNITSNQAPGLNVYEISVFLTKGQDEILKDYFNPKGNKYGEGFDGNQKRQIDFSMITKVNSVDTFDSSIYDGRDNSASASLPSDIMMIINERVTVTRGQKNVNLVVKPLQFDEYDRLMSKPFKRPLKEQAWRLIINDTANKADLIVGPSDTIKSYTVRYVKRPRPIIVGDLDGLTINGYEFGIYAEEDNPQADIPTGPNYTSGCELDPILHEEILQRAVELAKVAWTATGQDNAQMVLQAGQRSE